MDYLIGKEILKIKRIDKEIDYEFPSPYAIIFTLSETDKELVLSANNEASSDIYFSTEREIELDYGLEFDEIKLNNLKPQDELNHFLNEKIQSIRIAEYYENEIQGNGFIIKQGVVAGIEIKTNKHTLLFYNDFGGRIHFDDEYARLPNEERWFWRK
ncbi:MAG: hypothetical protein ACKOXB_10800 [Flavobacteriales bacterium]